jgi:alanine-glyoxylate transaminase/serine-glyoxylate transaminase/serine-pyruvate transaminase
MSTAIDTSARRVARGRLFFANPGPTNIPDSILKAVSQHTVDFNDAGFMTLYEECVAGLKRVLKTKQHLFFYTASGHGAWEASIVNLLSPGDTILVLETGNFSESWGRMAEGFGIKVQTIAADWRRGVDMAQVRAALAADSEHAIKAVCVVHNETSTGVTLPIADVRAAMDATGHPALLLSDTISSLGSMDFRMDEWGVDAVVGGSQKGLMLPTGLSFTGVSDKAMAAHKNSKLPKVYMDWSRMLTRPHKSFIGTVPISFFFGLKESLRLIEEEGLEEVFARHARLAEATRRCVRHWSGNNGPQLFCVDPSRSSNSVTAVLVPEGYDAEAVRKLTHSRFNVSLGGGLSRLGGKVFRIGHLGDLNEPMILGTLACVEMSLKILGIPHTAGGVDAAMAYLADESETSRAAAA